MQWRPPQTEKEEFEEQQKQSEKVVLSVLVVLVVLVQEVTCVGVASVVEVVLTVKKVQIFENGLLLLLPHFLNIHNLRPSCNAVSLDIYIYRYVYAFVW